MKNRTVALLSLTGGIAVGAMAVGAFVRYQQAGAKQTGTGTDQASTFELLPWLGLLFDLLAKIDWLNFLLVATGFVIVIMLLIAQVQKGDGFDMRSMFASRANGPCGDLWTVEPGRVFQTTAFLVTTWGFITVTARDKLSEWYLLVYVVLWAGSRAINQIVASKYPVAPGTNLEAAPPPSPPQVVTTTTTEVKP